MHLFSSFGYGLGRLLISKIYVLRVVFQITDVESGFIRWINADLVMHIHSKIGAIKNPALGGALISKNC